MEDDEDDFYGGGAGKQGGDGDQEMSGQPAIKAEAMDVSEEEEEDSDDDVQFTLDKPETTKTEPAAPAKAASKAVKVESSTAPQAKTTRQSSVPKPSSTGAQNVKSELLHNGKEGKDFPEFRTSDVNVDEDPAWPTNGKTITELDMDADLAEHSKPWRLPGTDVTDFFNYGFDEYTWTQYCAKQRTMSNTITELKDEDLRMKSMLGDGMPDMNQMMQMMMGGGGGGSGGGAGSDPSKMDFGQMMSMMNMPGGPQSTAGFNPSFNGQQGSNSPLPQSGQGFQGPSAGINMDGFSTQQMAIMQQEQQGHQGGGGRGRGRRGRGYY